MTAGARREILEKAHWLRWPVALVVLGFALASVAHGLSRANDFRHVVWNPGRLLLNGGNPYDVAAYQAMFGPDSGWFPAYGPSHLWLSALFGWMPVEVGAPLWFALNVLGLAMIAALVARAFSPGVSVAVIVLLIGLIVLTRPGRATLGSGQVTVLYTLATYVAWSQLQRRPALAAIGLAIALAKPPFGLPLLALVLLRRQWGVAVRGIGVFGLASLPMLVWLSIAEGSPSRLFRSILENVEYSEAHPVGRLGAESRIDLASGVARSLDGHWGGIAEVTAFVVVIAGVALLFATRRTRAVPLVAPAAAFVAGATTILAVAHQDYDMVLLAWPVAGLIALRGRSRSVLAARHAALLVVFAACVPAQTVARRLGLDGIAVITTFTTATITLALATSAALVLASSRRSEVD